MRTLLVTLSLFVVACGGGIPNPCDIPCALVAAHAACANHTASCPYSNTKEPNHGSEEEGPTQGNEEGAPEEEGTTQERPTSENGRRPGVQAPPATEAEEGEGEAPEVSRLILWGSSSAAPGSALPPAMAAVLGEPVQACGTVSLRLTTALTDEQRALLDGQYKAGARRALVYLGANDPTTNAGTRARDTAAVDAFVRASGLDVLWLPLPRYPDPTLLARATAQTVAERDAHVRYVDGPQPLSSGWHRGDGLHMSAAGAEEYAQRVGPLVNNPTGPVFGGLALGVAALGALWMLRR